MSNKNNKFNIYTHCWYCETKHIPHEPCDSDYEDNPDDYLPVPKRNKKYSENWTVINKQKDIRNEIEKLKNERLQREKKEKKEIKHTEDIDNFFKRRMKK